MSLVDDWEEKSIEPSFMPVEIQNDVYYYFLL